MELPHLGLQCSNKDCKQLDFLPIKCDACNNTFCAEHYKFERHNCGEGGRRNKVVPVCHKCQALVPAKNMSEQEAMELHLSNNCAPYKRNKIYTNRCNKAECKRKELIPFQCESCHLSFCIKHRHSADHDCQPGAASTPASTRQKCAAAAESRLAEDRLAESRLADLNLETRETQEASSSARQRLQPLVDSESCAAQHRQATTAAAAAPRRAANEVVQATNGNLSEEEALALAIAQSEAEAKKREEENRRRLVDAAAS